VGRIEKTWKELDFVSVDFTNGWSWGCGGLPLENREWAISHVTKDLIETRYKMPPCINEMLNRQHQKGGEDKKQEILHALGL